MPLQASGAISLGQIAAEYLDAAPHSMSEFRGRNEFPATGAISFSDAYSNYGKLVATLTYGSQYTAGGKYTPASTSYGYYDGFFGALSPKTFTHDGVTITVTGMQDNNVTQITTITMTGFTSTQTIGSVWSTLTKGSYTWSATNASFFDYNSGTATWSWLSTYTPNPVLQHNSSGSLTFKLT